MQRTDYCGFGLGIQSRYRFFEEQTCVLETNSSVIFNLASALFKKCGLEEPSPVCESVFAALILGPDGSPSNLLPCRPVKAPIDTRTALRIM